MTYTLLPEPVRGCFLAFATVILLVLLYCIIRMLDAGRRGPHLTVAVAVTLLAFALYQGMVMYQQEDQESFDVPTAFLAPALVIIMIYALWLQNSISAWQKNSITGMSVKEAMDRLPAGLLYYTESGIPVMINETMNGIKSRLPGRLEMDARHLWGELSSSENPDLISGKTGTAPDSDAASGESQVIFREEDGRVWDVKKDMMDISGVRVTELTAFDVSREYELTRELERKRFEAGILNKRLKSLLGTIEYITMNREMLKLKTALHDNVGQSILWAKRYLKNPESVDETQMLDFWRENIRHLINDEPEEWELPYYVISREAGQMGIDLNIIGELPSERSLIPVVDAAISVELGNTLKHADGTIVTVSVSGSASEYMITMTNNGKAPEGEIDERGGLSNLRRDVEEAGGRMEVSASPSFTLRVFLPKGDNI
ncbi:MAG: hypothetical protein IJT00_03145 [Lachnospiraceae bacterium]|nr:hypothetical protein [Lachnospiraceae bacterium]